MSNSKAPERRKRRGADNPTLADVARESGVSTITVSRVLNSPVSVRQATRERVEAAIERVGYVRNMLAGSLASANSRFIAVIVPSLSNVVFIVDEAQNLTPHEVKTIVTRAGENTKIILTGDIRQIDTPYLDEQSNGLSYVIDRLRGRV